MNITPAGGIAPAHHGGPHPGTGQPAPEAPVAGPDALAAVQQAAADAASLVGKDLELPPGCGWG